jgi:hypothetical protein
VLIRFSLWHIGTDHSDHCAITYQVQILQSLEKATHIKIPDAEVVLALCQNVERLSPDLNSFLQLHLAGAGKKSNVKKILISLREKREQPYSLEHYAYEIGKLIRIKLSQIAF